MHILPQAPTVANGAQHDTLIFVDTRNTPTGPRFCVGHRRFTTCIVWSEADYATEFEAYLAAVALAKQQKSRLRCPAEMQKRLILHYINRGNTLFQDDQPRAACVNQYERQGYDHAAATLDAFLDEMLSKPFLTDSVEISVRDGEYGYKVPA